MIATACPFCTTMMSDGINETGREEKLRVMDIAEVLAQSLAPGTAQSGGTAV